MEPATVAEGRTQESIESLFFSEETLRILFRVTTREDRAYVRLRALRLGPSLARARLRRGA